MPGHDPSMLRGLAEQLVVPEPNRTADQLTRGNDNCRIPKHIVKRSFDSPRSQCMEKNIVRIAGLV